MLVSIVLIGYILFTAYISGITFIHFVSKLVSLQNTRTDFTFTSLAGLCWITILLSVQHIFLKIGLASHLLLWLINTFVWSFNRKEFFNLIINQIQTFRNKPLKIHILYFLFLFGVLLTIGARAAIGDVADYHFQAIRWMEEHKVVPGIGNIRRQLGNNSNWFLLNAFFGFSFTGLRSVYVLNASLLLIVSVCFSEGIENLLNGKLEKLAIIKSVILFYLLLTIFRAYVGAVTNDYVITIFILYIFTSLLEISSDDLFSRIFLIIFILLMLTFKLSALPMLLLAVIIFFSLFRKLNLKIHIVFLLIRFLIIAPWVFTNVMHCGYLVYPISNVDLFDVDWKMRSSVLNWEVMANLAWARVPFADVEITKNLIFSQWFPLWLKSLDGFSVFLIGASILSTTFIWILFLIKRTREKILTIIKKENFFIIITGATAIYLWFTHGPTPRFVYGYLVFLLAAQFWVISNVFSGLQKQVVKSGKHIFLLLASVFFVSCVLFLNKNYSIDKFTRSIIVPGKYSEPKLNKTILVNGFVNVPVGNEQCWDSPIPCTSSLDSSLVWRGNKLEDGFKIKK